MTSLEFRLPTGVVAEDSSSKGGITGVAACFGDVTIGSYEGGITVVSACFSDATRLSASVETVIELSVRYICHVL